jgi:hypothetical protein
MAEQKEKYTNITRLIGGDTGKRKKNDFYPTPSWAMDYLLDNVTFEGNIWEPACGNGSISKELIKRDYNVYSSDLNDYGYGDTGIDFLKKQMQYDNIITNPPFNKSTEFALHGLNLVRNKLVLLNKLTFLEGKVRKSKLFSQNKLERVFVFSERLNFDLSLNKKTGGMLSFAWFIFDKNYQGKPTIEWI